MTNEEYQNLKSGDRVQHIINGYHQYTVSHVSANINGANAITVFDCQTLFLEDIKDWKVVKTADIRNKS